MTNDIMTNELMTNELMTNELMTNVTEPCIASQSTIFPVVGQFFKQNLIFEVSEP